MKPRQSENAYYYLDETLQIHADIDYLCGEDTARWSVGNYFATMGEAREASRQTLRMWQNLRIDTRQDNDYLCVMD